MSAIQKCEIHMTVTLTTRATEELAKRIEELAKREKVDKSTMIRRLLSDAVEAKSREEALRQYREGKVSLWKAAKMAGVSLWEMIDLITKEGIHLDYGPEELREDLKPARRKALARGK
jgi:predicted HTH domain antitoxin